MRALRRGRDRQGTRSTAGQTLVDLAYLINVDSPSLPSGCTFAALASVLLHLLYPRVQLACKYTTSHNTIKARIASKADLVIPHLPSHSQSLITSTHPFLLLTPPPTGLPSTSRVMSLCQNRLQEERYIIPIPQTRCNRTNDFPSQGSNGVAITRSVSSPSLFAPLKES